MTNPLQVQDHHCYPFLVVVPNSTCANWRREIKQWAPSLRVIAYFGSGAAKQMAHKYEMYPNNAKELCCHVVVTSYDAAADESSAKVLRRIPWTGMIVDEGHRLKNDQGLLYRALTSMKVPFRVLLTGKLRYVAGRVGSAKFLQVRLCRTTLENSSTSCTSSTQPRTPKLLRQSTVR